MQSNDTSAESAGSVAAPSPAVNLSLCAATEGSEADQRKLLKKEYDHKRHLEQGAKLAAQSNAWRKRNPERVKAIQKLWRIRHHERQLEKERLNRKLHPERGYKNSRKWRLKNLEFCAQQQREWRRKHPGYSKEYWRLYRIRKREFVRELQRKWKLANPERVYELHLRRRARQTRSDVGDAFVAELIKRWKLLGTFGCYYCNRRFKTQFMHIDHIIPISKGGKHTTANICRACVTCNLSKKDRPLSSFSVKGQSFLAL